jgi:hypothetical protein
MPNQIGVITEQQSLIENLDYLQTQRSEATSLHEALLLCRLGGGLLQFAETVYQGAPLSNVYASNHQREPQGRGAHFDIYGKLLNPDYPWLGVYNTAGETKVKAGLLPKDLAKSYFERFPEPSEAAHSARRDFSSIALNSPNAEVHQGQLSDHMGLVILQRVTGPHVVHNIVPEDSEEPGDFVKIILPKRDEETLESVYKSGMVSLDQLVTQSLPGDTNTERQISNAAQVAARIKAVRSGRSSFESPSIPGMLD